MTGFRRLSVFVLFLAFIFAAGMVWAGDPNGQWTSSTGSTISIWANMQTVNVTVTTPQGQSFKYNGWWTRFSDHFTYQASTGAHHCSFINSNKISVRGPNNSNHTWTRGISSVQPPQPQITNITGTWRSSSGSLVQVATNGNQILVTLIDTKGGRHEGIGRWLKYGQTFDYSIPGFSGAAVCTIIDSRRIDVVYGQRSTWTR